MAWLRASAIDRTPRAKRGDSYPRHRLGVVASTALCGFRDTAIRDTVHAVPCRADGVVDGHHLRHDARSGEGSCGGAFPRIRELVCVHDVGTRCDGIRLGAMGRNSCYRELADADSS